jgi:hypothetical protein
MVFITVAAAIAGTCGLLFHWSVALISPPSSNLSLPVRLYMLILWLVFGVAAFVAAGMGQDAIPIGIWIAVLSGGCALSFVISITERVDWSPRVALTIPKRWWLRWPAFLLYSGAAGGVLFSALLMGLTVLAYFVTFHWTWLAAVNAAGYRNLHDVTSEIFPGAAVGVLYVYCYAMTTVWLRNVLFRRTQPIYNWVIFIFLLAIGCLLPFLVSFLLLFREWNYQQHFHFLVTNPFAAMVEFAEGRYYLNQRVYLYFAAVWAGVATLCNAPWFFRQMRRFRPLEMAAAPPVSLAATGSVTAPLPGPRDSTPVASGGIGVEGEGAAGEATV